MSVRPNWMHTPARHLESKGSRFGQLCWEHPVVGGDLGGSFESRSCDVKSRRLEQGPTLRKRSLPLVFGPRIPCPSSRIARDLPQRPQLGRGVSIGSRVRRHHLTNEARIFSEGLRCGLQHCALERCRRQQELAVVLQVERHVPQLCPRGAGLMETTKLRDEESPREPSKQILCLERQVPTKFPLTTSCQPQHSRKETVQDHTPSRGPPMAAAT